MLIFLFEIICAFLLAISLIFIVIEIRSRFDRSFLIFGITNLLLSIFCGIDIWLQPDAQTIHWTRIQHSIAAYFPVLMLWYLHILIGKKNENLIRGMFFISTVFSVLFFTNLMLQPSQKEITSTIFYNLTFAPYLFISIMLILSVLFVNYSNCQKSERKVILFHFFGIIALSIGGVLDMVTIFLGHRIVPQVATFVIPGLLLFGTIVTSIFIDRLSLIIKERETTFSKLQDAYKVMEEVQSLKELGQSSAIINHEIRNYSFVISGYTKILLSQLELSEKHRSMLEMIGETIQRMLDFSQDILNFSKAKILSDKKPLSILNLINSCVQSHFPLKHSSICVESIDSDVIIHGDWNKLEHVFVNIFKNAFEAEAQKIVVKTIRNDSVLLLIIEDDGIGCDENQLTSLFKSFYTTKKAKGGTGLGMCIIRSIIESHGGHISAYSKNIMNDTHGLYLTLAFPVFKEEANVNSNKKDSVILIKDKISNLAQVIKIFQNVFVNPYVFQSVDDIDLKKSELENCAVYGSTSAITTFRHKYELDKRNHVLTDGRNGTVFVVDNSKNRTVYQFSERYILENLSDTNDEEDSTQHKATYKSNTSVKDYQTRNATKISKTPQKTC